MPRAWPRGTMVALWMGEAPGVWSATMACPASWYAVRLRACSERRTDLHAHAAARKEVIPSRVPTWSLRGCGRRTCAHRDQIYCTA
eukprot:1136238-Pelagomonas_calceolata.AAC.3